MSWDLRQKMPALKMFFLLVFFLLQSLCGIGPSQGSLISEEWRSKGRKRDKLGRMSNGWLEIDTRIKRCWSKIKLLLPTRTSLSIYLSSLPWISIHLLWRGGGLVLQCPWLLPTLCLLPLLLLYPGNWKLSGETRGPSHVEHNAVISNHSRFHSEDMMISGNQKALLVLEKIQIPFTVMQIHNQCSST